MSESLPASVRKLTIARMNAVSRPAPPRAGAMSVLHNRGSWRRRKKTTTENAAAACSPTIASVPKPVMLAVMSRSGSAPVIANAPTTMTLNATWTALATTGAPLRPVRPRTDGSRRARPSAKR